MYFFTAKTQSEGAKYARKYKKCSTTLRSLRVFSLRLCGKMYFFSPQGNTKKRSTTLRSLRVFSLRLCGKMYSNHL